MAHGHTPTLQPEKLEIGGVASRIGLPALFIGGIALGTAIYKGFHGNEDLLLHFYHAYLAAFVFFMAITLGSLAFVLIHHLTRAGWSTTVRRIAEGLSLNIFLLVIMIIGFFIPVDGETGAYRLLHHWMAFNPNPGGGVLPDDVLKAKFAYLNPPAFAIRMGVYLTVWCLIAWFFASQSAKQDQTGDPKISVKLELLAKPAIMFFAFSLTAFIIDWVMSLNAHWFSTIFGVYYFAGCMLSAFSSITLLTMTLQKRGLVGNAVGHEHYHDLGKWMFAFTFFWGYIAFSQYMLIWYANLPEETQFYIPRQFEGWVVVSLMLLIVHLLIPFPGLLSRHVKRANKVLAFWAVWSLCACALDIFWLVIPNQWINKLPAEAATMTTPAGNPDMFLTKALEIVSDSHDIYHVKTAHLKELVNYPFTRDPMMITILCFVGFAGLYIFSTMLALRGKSLVPTRDPRLNEALAFENI